MREAVLLKLGELVLKGLNRRSFEELLVKNVRRSIANLGTFSVTCSQSIIYVCAEEDDELPDALMDRLLKVFGIASVSRACVAEKKMENIEWATAEYLKNELDAARTFKVVAKRSDKHFPFTSPEISSRLGAFLLDRFPHLRVDLSQPEQLVTVEIREQDAFIHAASFRGAGGLPVGSGSRAVALISGGIDSPVAAWMMAKRGVRLTAVHFESPPYTSPQAFQKVVDLLSKVAAYAGPIVLYTVPFTEIQEQMRANCKEELFTIIMRRFMMLIAQEIAENHHCRALITGESLGQVASQTLWAIACTSEAVHMPILRPLIGFDKEEIIEISRQIGTFEISTRPFEDCCTVFTPKHPRTRPVLPYVKQEEQKLLGADLIRQAVDSVRMDVIEPSR